MMGLSLFALLDSLVTTGSFFIINALNLFILSLRHGIILTIGQIPRTHLSSSFPTSNLPVYCLLTLFSSYRHLSLFPTEWYVVMIAALLAADILFHYLAGLNFFFLREACGYPKKNMCIPEMLNVTVVSASGTANYGCMH